MATTKDVDESPNVSEQHTKTTFLSTKLKWRIEHFNEAIRFYKVGQSISSNTFVLPHLGAVWILDVYPNGNKHGAGCTEIYLRLAGFQAPNGSISVDDTKSIMADYKIYALNSTNEQKMITQNLSEFKIGSTAGSNLYHESFKKFVHSDGSLLVFCEVICLTSDKTFSVESSTNIGLSSNHQLTDHIGEMWKSQLFSDCILKVGTKSFAAHKCILGQWSEVFRKMFSLSTQEAESGIVEISDFSPIAIGAMLEFMYTGAVKTEVMDNIASELLALSDKYAVFSLKKMCETNLASRLTKTNVLKRAILADRSLAGKLKKACVNRLATDGRAVLKSQEWEHLKTEKKYLADELLELLVKDHPCFANMHEEASEETK